MRIRYGSQSDQGRIRTSNEDSFFVNGRTNLFLVADGMGGHAAGEIASGIARDTLQELLAKPGAARNPTEALQAAAQAANARIYEAQRHTAEYSGMGSTLTALMFSGGKYYVAQVGDSRAYLLRDGELSQLTKDHSVVWHLFETGVLRKQDLSRHPQKNLITRSIGPHPQVEADIESGEALENDLFLLCSDGLTDVLADDAIHKILSDGAMDPQQIADTLVNAANKGGGPDNVTVVVVRLEPGDAE